MLRLTFFHPLGYLGLERATQRIPMLEVGCWTTDGEMGFTYTFVCN